VAVRVTMVRVGGGGMTMRVVMVVLVVMMSMIVGGVMVVIMRGMVRLSVVVVIAAGHVVMLVIMVIIRVMILAVFTAGTLGVVVLMVLMRRKGQIARSFSRRPSADMQGLTSRGGMRATMLIVVAVAMVMVIIVHVVLLPRSAPGLTFEILIADLFVMDVIMTMVVPVAVPMMVMPARRIHPEEIDPEADTGNEQKLAHFHLGRVHTIKFSYKVKDWRIEVNSHSLDGFKDDEDRD
jgi:hypothetical protein